MPPTVNQARAGNRAKIASPTQVSNRVKASNPVKVKGKFSSNPVKIRDPVRVVSQA